MTESRRGGWLAAAGRFLKALGALQGNLFVALAFGAVVVPYGLLLRLVRRGADRRRGWFHADPEFGSIERMRRMF